MGLIPIGRAAELLDTTVAGVEQLMYNKVLRPAPGLEHAVAAGAPIPAHIAAGPCVDIAGAPVSVADTTAAAALSVDVTLIEGLCLTGRLRRVFDYAPADDRLRVALALPTVGPEDIELARRALNERDEQARDAPPPPDPAVVAFADAVGVRVDLVERFADHVRAAGVPDAVRTPQPPRAKAVPGAHGSPSRERRDRNTEETP